MGRLRVAIALVVWLVGACGESTPEPAVAPRFPASVAELTGAWHPEPFLLDPILRGRIAQACARDMEMGPGAIALLIDVRGAGVASVRMNKGQCDALVIEDDGTITGAGAGSSGIGDGGALADVELGRPEQHFIVGSGLKVEGWSALGQAGPGIRLIVVQPVDHVPVVATLENGWYGAWWPARPGEPPRDGTRFPPAAIRAYNALGELVNETRI